MTERLTKAEALAHWRALPDAMPMKPRAINNRHKGSTYGHDGVRLEGSRAFIDACLSRLKPLLAAENGRTRLSLNYQRVEPREGKRASGGDFVCYVKVHQRGSEAQHVNAIFGLGGN